MEHTTEDVQSLADKIASLDLTEGELHALGAALAHDGAEDDVTGFGPAPDLADLLISMRVVSGPIPNPGRFEQPRSGAEKGFTLNEELLA